MRSAVDEKKSKEKAGGSSACPCRPALCAARPWGLVRQHSDHPLPLARLPTPVGEHAGINGHGDATLHHDVCADQVGLLARLHRVSPRWRRTPRSGPRQSGQQTCRQQARMPRHTTHTSCVHERAKASLTASVPNIGITRGGEESARQGRRRLGYGHRSERMRGRTSGRSTHPESSKRLLRTSDQWTPWPMNSFVLSLEIATKCIGGASSLLRHGPTGYTLVMKVVARPPHPSRPGYRRTQGTTVITHFMLLSP